MDYEGYNVSHLSKICKIDGKRYKVLETLDSDFAEMLTAHTFHSRIVINPEKRPYNMSEVILWTLDDGNTVNRLEMENDNEECYYFERLERVLATQVAGMMQLLLFR